MSCIFMHEQSEKKITKKICNTDKKKKTLSSKLQNITEIN